MPEHFTLTVTGHRPQKLGGFGDKAYERLFEVALKAIRTLNPEAVYTGMALGWDTAIAEACAILDVPFDAYVPFEGQESKWSNDAKRFYHQLLGKARVTHFCSPPGYSAEKMHVRDRRMVDDLNGNGLVGAMWNEEPDGGTAATVRYAMSKGIEIINFYPEWLKGTRHV